MRRGSPEHVEVWKAINHYVAACGGDPSNRTMSPRRMEAVVSIESALAALLDEEPPFVEDCRSCHGHGYFRRDGTPTVDRRERKCLDCTGTGKGRMR